MNTQPTGYLYLPMEIAVREFDSRLLIAIMAVERGMEVVLGQKWLLEENIEALPKGLWIFKTLSKRDSKRMRRAKEAGHLVASIDEEVPAMAEGSGGLLWVSQDAAELCDSIFCLGEEHAKSLAKKWPQIENKLVLTGNPRWDYLRSDLATLYGAQAAAYNKQHGRIILINTNSGNFNPAKKKPEEVYRDYVRDGKLDPNNAEQMAFWKDYSKFEKANFEAAIPMTRRLAKEFPGHTIILRPHPSERLEAYAEKLADLANVKVLFEGSAAPWIMASDVLVHTDCTTGLEAFALGKPSICFETVPSTLHTILLSGRLSFTVQTEDDVLREAHRIVDGKLDGSAYPKDMTQLFHRFFSAQHGPLAAEQVADAALKTLGISGRVPEQGTKPSWAPLWNYRAWWPTKSFRRKMFPPIDHALVEKRLRDLAMALGKQDWPAFVDCGDSLIHLYSPRLAKPKPVGSIAVRAVRHVLGIGR